MRVNTNIFKADGIAGIYGQDFDARFAQRLGAAVASFFGANNFIIARDGRSAHNDLAYAATDGAMHVGSRVTDIGLASNPQFRWAIRSCGATAGIMVTSSGGFKVFDREGKIRDGGLLRQIFDSQAVSHQAGGQIKFRDLLPEYSAAVACAVGWHNHDILNVSLDAPESVRRLFGAFQPISPNHEFAAKIDDNGDRLSVYSRGKLVSVDNVSEILNKHYRPHKLSSPEFDVLRLCKISGGPFSG